MGSMAILWDDRIGFFLTDAFLSAADGVRRFPKYQQTFRRNNAAHRPSILMWDRDCGKPRCFRYL